VDARTGGGVDGALRGLPVSLQPARRSLASAARTLAGLAAGLALALGLLVALATSSTLSEVALERSGEYSPVSLGLRKALLEDLLSFLRAPEHALVVHAGLSALERAHFREVKQLLRSAVHAAMTATLATVLLLLLAWRADPPTSAKVALGDAMRNAGFALILYVTVLGLQVYRLDAGFAALQWLGLDRMSWLLPAESLTARCFPASYFQTLAIWLGGSLMLTAILVSTAGLLLAGWSERRQIYFR